MSVVTENDLKELKTFISEHFSELEKGQTDIIPNPSIIVEV
jgi:hypothetical protein